MGGPPSKQTPCDQRLKRNNPMAGNKRPTQPSPKKKAGK